MADQNQNTIPGTLRTLKTDLDLNNTNPQDRLQQAGNFVQARPDLESPATPPVANTSNKGSLSPLDINDTKQDIPESKPLTPQDPSYSWSNIDTNTSTTIDIKKDIVTTSNTAPTKPELKSGFSALDETLDLPLGEAKNSDAPIPATPLSNISSLTKPEDDKSINSKSSSKGIMSDSPTPPTSNIPDFTRPEEDTVILPKSSSKAIITGLVVIVLIGLIGTGVYFYSIRSIPTQTNNTPEPNTPTTTPDTTVKPLFTEITKSDIAFNDAEPIRKTITTSLNGQKAPLVELNLTKDSKKVSLADMSTAFGLTIPTTITDNVTEYWLYGYNQEGIYKLTAAIQLKSGQDAKTLVDNWSTAIPRDLSSFSLSSASRIVNKPEIKTTTITNTSGKTFTNYYYNYTSSTDSTDVSSMENYIVIASSQNSMTYLLNQIQ
jgi:hypothetical protein